LLLNVSSVINGLQVDNFTYAYDALKRPVTRNADVFGYNERSEVAGVVVSNIAAEYGESMTFVSSSRNVAEDKVAMVADLFRLVGDVKVCEERMVASGMMMAGCGIAYVMRYLRAMMEGGVEMGFYPADALKISMQTMSGAVTLLEETGLHPEAAIDKVTTPGGFTIKGLNELDHAGFNSAVIRSLKAGLKKD
jgi:pyrroline-5-carboxylate reductase